MTKCSPLTCELGAPLITRFTSVFFLEWRSHLYFLQQGGRFNFVTYTLLQLWTWRCLQHAFSFNDSERHRGESFAAAVWSIQVGRFCSQIFYELSDDTREHFCALKVNCMLQRPSWQVLETCQVMLKYYKSWTSSDCFVCSFLYC